MKITPTPNAWRRTRPWVHLVTGLLFVGAVSGCSVGLDGSSSCEDYMNDSQQGQQYVVSQLAGKYQKGVWATPMGFPGVAYYCAGHPDTTLDEFFAAAESY